MQADFWKPIIFISTGVMGLILLSASYLNNKTADLVSCKDYQVIDKHRKKGVITSYSIHYTKLYDIILKTFQKSF